MKYFIIAEEAENKIIKVKDENLCLFLEQYTGKILFEGDSIADLFIKFEQNVLAAPLPTELET